MKLSNACSAKPPSRSWFGRPWSKRCRRPPAGAAALPGMPLVARGPSGVLTDLIPCEDAYTGERSLGPPVGALVEANDLGLADRTCCTPDDLREIAGRPAYFLI